MVLIGVVFSGVYWSNVGRSTSSAERNDLARRPRHSRRLPRVRALSRPHLLGTPRYWAERRTFLRTIAAALGGLALWRIGEAAAPLLNLQAADRRFTGSYNAGDFTGNDFPRVIWLSDSAPTLDESAWRLRLEGHVARPVELDYEGALDYRDELVATIDCTGGWHSTQQWRGVRLGRLFDRAGLSDEAASVTVRSATGTGGGSALKRRRPTCWRRTSRANGFQGGTASPCA